MKAIQQSKTCNQPPLVFLKFEHVLVTDAANLDQFRFLPLLYRLNIGVDAESMRPFWLSLVACNVRTNLRRLHDEFRPRYVISSGMAGRMKRTYVVDLLRRMGLDFVADNLHSAWCVLFVEGTTDASWIASWLTRWRRADQSFVVLDNAVTGCTIGCDTVAARTVLCNPAEGLTTHTLTRASAILDAALLCRQQCVG
jgi:hypothetical protein